VQGSFPTEPRAIGWISSRQRASAVLDAPGLAGAAGTCPAVMMLLIVARDQCDAVGIAQVANQGNGL